MINRILFSSFWGALLLIAVFSSCKKDKLISDSSPVESQLESFTKGNHLNVQDAKNCFTKLRQSIDRADTIHLDSITLLLNHINPLWDFHRFTIFIRPVNFRMRSFIQW